MQRVKLSRPRGTLLPPLALLSPTAHPACGVHTGGLAWGRSPFRVPGPGQPSAPVRQPLEAVTGPAAVRGCPPSAERIQAAFKTTHLDGLSVVHFDHVEAETINPFSWSYKYTGGKIEMVANIYQDLKKKREYSTPIPSPGSAYAFPQLAKPGPSFLYELQAGAPPQVPEMPQG